MVRAAAALAFASAIHALCARPSVGLSRELLSSDDACTPADATSLLQHGFTNHRRGLEAGGAAQIPEAMQAVSKSPTGYVVSSHPVPALTSGQALIKVAASSVNPLDWKLSLPGIMGRDFSGTVARVEAPCDGFEVGQKVWGDQVGAWAEYIAVSCTTIGHQPSSLSPTEAGVLPHVTLTALQAFQKAGAPWNSNPTVLILGGSGGVGTVAIQLAKDLGAGTVITTCSPDNFELVKGLGADQVIDYHTEDYWSVLEADSVDVVLDAVGEAGTGAHADQVLKTGGTLASLLGFLALAGDVPKEGVDHVSFEMSTGAGVVLDLDTLKGFAEAGTLVATIDSAYPLAEISEAVTKSKEGHSVGKIAIVMDA